MPALYLIAFSCVVVYFARCMLVASRARPLVPRLPASHNSITRLTSEKTRHFTRSVLRESPLRPLNRSYTTEDMFKKAVDTQQATATKQGLSQHFLSSSPTGPQNQSTLYRPFVRPLSTGSGNILKPATQNASGGSNQQKKHYGLKSGIKRTSSGLAKAIDGKASFEDLSHAKRPRQEVESTSKPSVPASKKNQITTSSTVYYDENDFDSDIDLDIEDPATKGTLSNPNLPAVPNGNGSTKFAPTQPLAAAHETHNWTATYDSGYVSRPVSRPSEFQDQQPAFEDPPSSVPLPWSSSPTEHLQTSPKDNTFKQYAYNQKNVTGIASARVTVKEEKARPSRRRTLPWLQEQNVKVEPSSQSTVDPKSQPRVPDPTSQVFTPLPKDKSNHSYAWNTTQSALKEQQKNLRQANKKLIKTSESSEDAFQEAIAKRKKTAVHRIFLSEEQKHVLSLIVDQKKSVFFTGSAGTGKSVLLREVIKSLRVHYKRESDRVAVTASTGLAACNIGGVTLHSFAGIGLGKEPAEELVKKIKKNQKAKHRWMRTKVLIIDEISMVDGELFDKLENIARILKNNGRPFGGIQLVITGDFFQLPPVPDHGKVAKFAFDAGTWNTSIEHTIGLHHVFRQKDPEFANMLNEMREGRLSEQSVSKFRQLERTLKFEDDLEATELFPTRQEVDQANNRRMMQLVGETKVFEARDGGSMTDIKFRDKLLQNCMAPDTLHLKKGAQVMLIKNIDETLVNGSLGRVVGFMSHQMFDSYQANEETYHSIQNGREEDFTEEQKKFKNKLEIIASTSQVLPLVRFLGQDGTTRDMLVERSDWKVELPNGEVQASRSQVPLILAWALSIHKAQGQTLERVKVDLGKVFEKGQAYVALSRATSMAGLQIMRFDPKKVLAHDRVRNFYASLSRAEQVIEQ